MALQSGVTLWSYEAMRTVVLQKHFFPIGMFGRIATIPTIGYKQERSLYYIVSPTVASCCSDALLSGGSIALLAHFDLDTEDLFQIHGVEEKVRVVLTCFSDFLLEVLSSYQ